MDLPMISIIAYRVEFYAATWRKAKAFLQTVLELASSNKLHGILRKIFFEKY